MSPVVSQQELESALWAAANSLRGPVDPSDYKAYIFPFLFFKRISDTWDFEHERALADGYTEAELAAGVEDDYHSFKLPDGCHWRDLLALTENVGAGLQEILQRIEETNPDKLAGIFGDVAWGNKEKLPEHALLRLIEIFNGLRLDPESVPHDMLGNAYEYLLKQFADVSGASAGQFFTPRAVVRLLVKILNPRADDSIHDPTCGSGGMLVETVQTVKENGGDPRTLKLYGQEVSLTTAAIARMNLFLHGIETFSVRRGDTLRNPRFVTADGELEKFQCVIANPPFSIKDWGQKEWAHDPYGRSRFGVPPAGNADWAFIEHMLATLAPKDGRMAVVMPHGVLFRGGAEQKIRKAIVEAGMLEAVIGLPQNLFYNTSIPACVLVFRMPEGSRDDVLFIDASARFVKGRNQNEMSSNDISVIADAYRTGEDSVGEGGLERRLVSVEEIADNSFDLNIGRYVRSAISDVVDVGEALRRYHETRADLTSAQTVLDCLLQQAGYSGED